jgi:hypothetical protein
MTEISPHSICPVDRYRYWVALNQHEGVHKKKLDECYRDIKLMVTRETIRRNGLIKHGK